MKLLIIFFIFPIYLANNNNISHSQVITLLIPTIAAPSPPIYWTSSCTDTARNLTNPFNFPTYDSDLSYKDSKGPKPKTYPKPNIPENCELSLWRQIRIINTIAMLSNMELGFCHHYCPDWLPPDNPEYRVLLDWDNEEVFFGCVDRPENYQNYSGKTLSFHNNFKEMQEKTQKNKEKNDFLRENLKQVAISFKQNHFQDFYYSTYKGLDSASFVAFAYNFGLGVYLVPELEDLACGEEAPGYILDIKDIENEKEKLNPGDLLFIVKNERISRVLLWTGLIASDDMDDVLGLESLLRNYREEKRQEIFEEIQEKQRKNEDIYIIADSSNYGPAFRLFLGDYIKYFVFARRVFGEETLGLVRKCEDLDQEDRNKVENTGYIWGKRKEIVTILLGRRKNKIFSK